MEYSWQKDSLKDRHGQSMYVTEARRLKTADFGCGQPWRSRLRCVALPNGRERLMGRAARLVSRRMQRHSFHYPDPVTESKVLQPMLLGGGDLKKRRKKQEESLDQARAAKAEGLDSRKRRFADSALSCSKTATGERRC